MSAHRILQAMLSGLCVGLLLAACSGQTDRAVLAGRTELADADVDRGREAIVRYGCASCHTIPGISGPASNVGPPLAQMARRAYVGGVLPNTPEDLVRWLRDPPAVDPRTAMPNMGVSAPEARDIAAYLYTLD